VTAFVYNTAATFNGFIADENNSLDWLFEVPETDDDSMAEFMANVGVQVMGSTTYEWLLRTELLLDEPEKWQNFFGAMPTIVFSSRDLPVPKNADITVVSGPVSAHVDRLRELAAGKDVWIVGGGELAGQFFDAGSLNRIEITLAPASLKAGAPLFPRIAAPRHLHLVSTTQRGQFVDLVYEVR